MRHGLWVPQMLPSLVQMCPRSKILSVDHLVNNAGIATISKVEDWHDVCETKPVIACKAAVINYFETLRIELGWTVGITIATPGLIKTNLALKVIDEEPSLGIIPMGSAFECGKAIVKSACRGDMYVTDPSWVKVLFPWKVLFPELVDWASRLLFRLSANNSRKKGNLNLSINSQNKAE
ncbi:hypothetical protein TanjilG_27504 [Lupinus angustifolius]|uniref:Uncharacterized protein n=1 Tax=Lupinus angustifolius TaxID=3871 RepID=A0A4P1R2X2_LUPAN|nr:hypothetical protein TanjilG_27504 [Lupinus angustifolius]